MKIKLALRASSLLMLSMLLLFCGQKGALYIQEDKPETEQSSDSQTVVEKPEKQSDK